MAGSGKAIDYSEWLMATSDKLSVANLKFAFEFFDKGKLGMIGQEEISNALKEHEIEKEEFNQIIAEVNGTIGC